jgi:hypothetical protein
MIRRRALYFYIVPALALALPAMAGPAKPKPKPPAPPRVVTIEYANVCSAIVSPSGGPSVADCPTDQNFSVHKGEKFASISVTDDSGRPAAVLFHVTATGVSNEIPVIVCGTATRLEVGGGTDYTASPTFSVGDAGCPTPPTSGTIKITLFTK